MIKTYNRSNGTLARCMFFSGIIKRKANKKTGYYKLCCDNLRHARRMRRVARKFDNGIKDFCNHIVVIQSFKNFKKHFNNK